MSNAIILVNGIKLWYEALGNSRNPAIILIMGNSSQGIIWPDVFCQALIKQGYYVIRFD